MEKCLISFTVEPHWTPDGLVIECPTAAARDFISRSLEDEFIVIRVSKEPKGIVKKQCSEGVSK